jgi:hypothetical protein
VVLVFKLLYLFITFIAAPVCLLWGWIRWAHHRQLPSFLAKLSFIAFLLATASTILVIVSMIYTRTSDAFLFFDTTYYHFIIAGYWLSGVGLVLTLVGIWRKGPVRVHALICTLGTLLYWLAIGGTVSPIH